MAGAAYYFPIDENPHSSDCAIVTIVAHEYDTATSTCTTTIVAQGTYGPNTLTKGPAYYDVAAEMKGYKLVIGDVS